MIWTEEQKTEMRRLRDEGVSNNLIGQMFGVSGDVIRKVLVRYNAGESRRLTAPERESMERATREVHAEANALVREEPRRFDSLRRLHDEFDAKVPERAVSRPQWAGRPPIMPKDFQKERFTPEE